MSLASKIPPVYKAWLKARLAQLRLAYVRAFRSYDAAMLKDCLRRVGVNPGDSVMLHSASGAQYGFRGSVDDLADVFIDAVGPNGNLLMVSLPYRSSSLEYLSGGRQFDVRKTPSMMGLVSELFRRRPGVLRSEHPTHPVLASGPKAEWFVAEHPNCVHPCGPGTPFGRLLEADGKAVFLNVPLATLTFFHYLEHLVMADLPFPLYTEQAFEVTMIDRQGRPRVVRTHVFTRQAIEARRFPLLEGELQRRKMIRRARVGATEVQAVNVRDVVDCVLDMRRAGRYFYEFGADKPHAPQAVETVRQT